MGWKEWMWSPKSTGQSTSNNDSTLLPPSSSNPRQTSQTGDLPTSTSNSPPAPEPSRPLSPDEQAEQEFRDLLRELDEPSASLTTATADSPLPRHANPSQVPSALISSRNKKIDPDALHPTSLLPTEMSCRAAFDAAFYCQSMGGQFTNLYRYGGIRNCSEMWSNFWFCMRTNRGGISDDERIDRVRQHYWEREKKYRDGPSSEDIWDVRTRRIHGAFDGDYEALERGEKE